MGLFTKSSPKKKTEPDTKENKKTSSSSRSPAKSSAPSPTKSIRDRERIPRKGSASRSTHRTHYPHDTHPLNLPPDERDRRRSAMSSDSEQDDELFQMDIDPETPEPHQHVNGMSDGDQVNGDASPIPPPHKSPSPPPKPAYDPEACKATGNKYFKAKDYPRAVQEYTKGGKAPPRSCTVYTLHKYIKLISIARSSPHYRTPIGHLSLQPSRCLHVREPIRGSTRGLENS